MAVLCASLGGQLPLHLPYDHLVKYHTVFIRIHAFDILKCGLFERLREWSQSELDREIHFELFIYISSALA